MGLELFQATNSTVKLYMYQHSACEDTVEAE